MEEQAGRKERAARLALVAILFLAKPTYTPQERGRPKEPKHWENCE